MSDTDRTLLAPAEQADLIRKDFEAICVALDVQGVTPANVGIALGQAWELGREHGRLTCAHQQRIDRMAREWGADA